MIMSKKNVLQIGVDPKTEMAVRGLSKSREETVSKTGYRLIKAQLNALAAKEKN